MYRDADTTREDSTRAGEESLTGFEANNFRAFRSKLKLETSPINKNMNSTEMNPFQPITTVISAFYF